MLCYQCGSTLGSGKYCLRCGADVTMYRRIVRLSNRYYNLGLEKAKVRDLSGALEALHRSLEIDKRNIQARNLMGLVLYEMGEVVEALCQWVISTNYQPEDNPASAYVKHLQDNRTELDKAGQGIRKYNGALEHAFRGNEDLARIQLEWVLKEHPSMVKAHLLMALLEIERNEYGKAEKELKAVLKIDRGNLQAERYLQELAAMSRHQAPVKAESFREKARNRVEKIQQSAEETRSALSGKAGRWLRFLAGMFVVICLFLGIILPTEARRRSTAVSQATAQYARQLESLRRELSDRDAEKEAYETLLSLSQLTLPDDLEAGKTLLSGINSNSIDSDNYRQLYSYWKNALEEAAAAEETAESTEANESTESPESSSEAQN